MRDRDYEHTEEKKFDGMAMTPTFRRFLSPHEQIDHDMTNHAPANPGVVEQFESLRRAAKLFAHTVIDTCPDSRERSLAITSAEQALMWAVASIARHQ